MLLVNPRIRVPLAEFRWQYSRSSGPGGQNVNKVNSKVTMHWPVTATPSLPEDVRERFCDRFGNRISAAGELVIHSQRYRDQEKNVQDCLAKLREMLLAVATPPRPRRATRPTRASQRRRVDDKKARSATKRDRRGPAGEA